MTTHEELVEEARGYKQQLLEQMFGADGVVDAAALPARLGRGNVLGVGFGAKLVGGAVLDAPALRVYVRTKQPRIRLGAAERVPEEVDGIATDVVAVGDLSAQLRPVPCGVSIGHVDVTAGTLGCLVDLGDGAPHLLSNNHVLADSGAATLGDPILQPGPADGGDPDDPIAELTSFVPIAFDGAPNAVDAAVARVLDPTDVRPEILDVGLPVPPPVDAALYQSVLKHGRTTAHTVGVVVDLAADIQVRFGTRTALFRDQLAVVGIGASPFSDGGDSGSLIVDAVDLRPVALLFAGGGGTTFGNPIAPVLEAFGATIVGADDGGAP